MKLLKRRIFTIIISVFVLLKILSLLNIFFINELTFSALWPLIFTGFPLASLFLMEFNIVFGIVLFFAIAAFAVICSVLLIVNKKGAKFAFLGIIVFLCFEAIILLLHISFFTPLVILGSLLNFVVAALLVLVKQSEYINQIEQNNECE